MIAITTVVGFFLNSRLGQYALGAAGVLALGTWFALHHQHKGAVKERVRVETKGKKIDAKAVAARTAAERDARRVLESRWLRD